jgi:mannose-6-phosphate isomerase-like protein (cupin superfamily)
MSVGELAGLGAIHADDALTNGAYELFEARTPKGVGPPLHVHRAREEAFYVVSGRFRIVCGDHETEAGPGGFVMVPRGTPHRFESLADDARLVFVVSPPGLEGYFRDGAEMRQAGRPDLDVRIELARRYDAHPVLPA